MAEPEKCAIEEHDQRVHWRCPMLGGEATFRYCRKVSDGMPCARLVGCWKTVFDVVAFLERHYKREEIAAVWNRPRPDKMTQLLDLIARAKKKK